MPSSLDSVLRALRDAAERVKHRAHVPYTRAPEAAALLLSDGTYVPGVRVESASFSLLIPPLLNALTTATALGRRDVVAVAFSRPMHPDERIFLPGALGAAFDAPREDVLVREGPADLPTLTEQLRPFLPDARPDDAEAGILLARRVAERAHVPASHFTVGCVLQTSSDRLIPGVNVEHDDWARILCAERNALGTAVTYGALPAEALYLSCPDDPAGSPCGACRQVLVELAPEATLWMDRQSEPPASACPPDLLPGSFSGQALLRDA